MVVTIKVKKYSATTTVSQYYRQTNAIYDIDNNNNNNNKMIVWIGLLKLV